MSKIHWSTQVSADFNTAADWSTKTVPGAADDAILDASGKAAYTVTASTSETVNSIQTASTATLSITGGTFTASAGTGSGVNAGTILIGNNTVFSVGGALNNSGAINLNSGGNTTELFLSANTTLSGAGKVTLGDSGANFIFGATATTKLTNVDNTIAGAGQLGNGQMTFVNQAAGVVNAVGGNALILNTDAQTVANAGLLEASGAGGLTISGTTVDSSSGGVIQANTGSAVNLLGAHIVGGTLKTSGSGVIETAANNRTSLIDGVGSTVSNTGALNVTNNAFLNVQGKIANTGVISLLSGGNTTELVLAANTTLSGAGQVTLSDNGQNFIFGATATTKLTNVDNTISGAGQLGDGQMTFVNQAAGVVDATGANALILNTGAQMVTNAGLLEATGAGGLTISGTKVDDSTGGVIQANTGSVVNLLGADIIGGTLKALGTGVIETAANNRTSVIDGASFAVSTSGALNITNNAYLTVQGSIINTGVISLLSVGNDTRLIVGDKNATISGGAVTLSDNGANLITGTLSGVSPNQTVSTLTNKSVISGAGTIGFELTLINNATIDATGANALIIATGDGAVAGSNVVTNAGLLESTNPGALGAVGGLILQNVVIANTKGKGIVEANGANTHVDLQGATIQGGALTAVNGGVFQTAANNRTSLIDGSAATVTLTGALNITNNAFLTAQGTLKNTGAISLLSVGNDTRFVVGAGGLTLSGGGAVTLSDNSANIISAAAASATLTNVDNVISGAGDIGFGSLNLINQAAGVINATGANAALVINTGGQAVTNAGLIEATGAAGLLIQSTTVDDSTGGMILAANGSIVRLQGADIIGGTLQAKGTGGFQTTVNDRGTLLDGSTSTVTLNGPLNITNNAFVTAQGTLKNTGTISLLSVGNDTRFVVGAGGLTLTGGGAVTLSDNGANLISAAAVAATLTNVDNTISGAGDIGFGSLSLTNQKAGVINATGATAALILDTGGQAVTNAGLIEATGAAGLLIRNTTVDDSTGGVILAANGSIVRLQGADIIGGTLQAKGTGVFQTTSSDRGTLLDGTAFTVTLNGPLNITNNAFVTAQGTLKNTGTISLLSVGNDTRFVVGAPGLTLTGGGAVTLSDNANNTISAAAASATLTNVDNVISGAGDIGFGSLNLINQKAGVIDATGANALVLDTGANTITNAGLIESDGTGGLTIQSAIANTGTLLAHTGTLRVVGTLTNLSGTTLTGGTYEADAGATLQLNPNTTIVTDAATIILSGAGSTIQSLDTGSSAQVALESTLTAITAAGVLEVLADRNYTTKNAINNAGTIQLGGGTFASGSLTDTSGSKLTGFGTVASVFSDAGTVTSSGGALAFTGVGDTFSGALNGTEIDFAGGTDALNSGATIGAKALSILGGAAVTVNANLAYAGTFSDGSGTTLTVGKGKTLTVTGASTFAGTVNGNGTLAFGGGTQAINNGASFNVANLSLSGGATTTFNRNFSYAGNLTQGAATQLALGGRTLTLTGSGSTLAGSVTGTGTLVFGGGDQALNAGASLTVANWSISGADSASVNENLTYAGTFMDGAGTTLTIAAGDTLTLTGASSFAGTVGGAGTLAFAGGTQAVNSGAIFSVSNWSISGAAATTLNESLTYGGAFSEGAGATLTVAAGDTLSLTGAASLSGVFNGAGVVKLSNATLSGLTVGGTATLSDTGTVDQTGTVTIGDAGSTGATLSIGAGATYQIDNGADIGRGASKASSIKNSGLFIKSGGGVSKIGVKITDTGAIEVAGGTLDFTKAITGRGTLTVDAHATLEVESSAASTLDMTFNGRGAVLALGSPSQFAATINGFSQPDTIDLLKTLADGATLGANDTLVITNGAATVATLQLAGNYAGATFNVASDGNGGTNITVTPGPGFGMPLGAAAASRPQTAASGPNHLFIAAMASLGGDPGGPVSMWTEGHGVAGRQNLFTPRSHAA